MKRLSVLGSTGSIGVKVLDIVGRFPDLYQVVALAAGYNVGLLAEQILKFRPACVSLADGRAAEELARRLAGRGPEVLFGQEGLTAVATMPEVDLVVGATVGTVALAPLLAAVKNGKKLALANKEVLVMAGELVMREAAASGCQILPIDSETSAVFQALKGNAREDVRRVILTASGGPFLEWNDLGKRPISVEEALNHPRWKMGKKISVDSASLMNKGLEVIEAHWLFDLPVEKIEVHIHPESVVHSLVEFRDGSVIAQMAITDMRLPIAYALSYPERLPLDLPALDLVKIGRLSFLKPDEERFPCLKLAYQAAEQGASAPSVLNAANDVAVNAFLENQLKFQQIPEVVARTLEGHTPNKVETIEQIQACDRWARDKAYKLVQRLGRKS